MSKPSLDEIVALASMGRALTHCKDLDSASMRTALYIWAGVAPKDIARLDETAVRNERTRRELFNRQKTEPAESEG